MFLYLFIIVSGIAAVIYAIFLIRILGRASSGSPEMVAIAQAIQSGAHAYLRRQARAIFIVGILIGAILWGTFGFLTALGFFIGAIASLSAGFIGMIVSTRANSKVAEAAKSDLESAFSLAFRGGSVTGFLVGGLGLLSVAIFYFLTRDLNALVALGFGGSLISVFARLGGGIYTKAADVGADLVGKIEVGIPEDDPRNPAVIADNVGDNVGDCAGMAADLFETYVVTIIAAMLLGSLTIGAAPAVTMFPLLIAAVTLLASILGSFFVRVSQKEHIMQALYSGLVGSAIFALLGYALLLFLMYKDFIGVLSAIGPGFWPFPSASLLFIPLFVGLGVTAGMVIVTEYFTSKKFQPVQDIAHSSTTGHATNIIAGLAYGMRSTTPVIILIVGGMLLSFWAAGLYGIALATLSMLSLVAIIVALDAYGPITDNAGGIAEMANLEQSVRDITDPLDAVGNTTKAVTKGYAIASAGLAALVLFAAYIQEIAAKGKAEILFAIDDPLVLAGVFIGGALPYLLAASAMQSVGRAAGSVVEEVRRQFRGIPGILEDKAKPDYAAAVDIVTKAALQEMVFPSLLPLVVPVLVGFLLGPKTLGGLLIGVIVTGIFVAVSMTTGGAAWDNAKKYIEEGNLGGKGSKAHQAAVTGDTVGDPYKDTAGTAINPMIKVANIVALLLVGFLV